MQQASIDEDAFATAAGAQSRVAAGTIVDKGADEPGDEGAYGPGDPWKGLETLSRPELLPRDNKQGGQ